MTAQAPWRAFGEELGVLFQIVDDVLDGDGYATALGEDGARALAGEAAGARPSGSRARCRHLRSAELVDALAVRTA